MCDCDKWMEIETAPKDGTEILLCSKFDMAVCYWRDDDVMREWTWGCGNVYSNPEYWMPFPVTPYNYNSIDDHELLAKDVIERSAKALFESGDHKMLAAAGYSTDFDGQPLTIKLDYRKKARTVIKAAIGVS